MTASEMMTNFLTLGRPNGDTSYDNLGFYSYHPKDNILPSYVAWLALNDVPSEARYIMRFNDGTTSISEVSGMKSEESAAAAIYTLQGIRIDPSAMQKGTIYIVDGKKILIQ
jgi:hypothetical protein